MQAVPQLYSMAQKLTCEFCKIFTNSYFVEHPRTAAFEVNDLVYMKFYTYKKRCGDLLLCYFLKRDLIDFLPCYYWKYCYCNNKENKEQIFIPRDALCMFFYFVVVCGISIRKLQLYWKILLKTCFCIMWIDLPQH